MQCESLWTRICVSV